MPEAPPRRRRVWPFVAGAFALAVVLLVLFWNWDWFIPIVDSRASAALGRPVSIAHLHVYLGRTTKVVADDVVIGNPAGFPDAGPEAGHDAGRDAGHGRAPLAHIARLTVVADVMQFIHTRHIVLPLIGIDEPRIDAVVLEDGKNNFTIAPPGSQGGTGGTPSIGTLQINQGEAHFVDAKLRSNVTMTVQTRDASGSEPAAIVVDAHGLYAKQKVTGHFVGGALLTLRQTSHPYPIDLHLENGGTTVSLVGTVQNPLNFAGARVKMHLAGSDMYDLFPLTGIPVPHTPPFSISGNVDYAKPRIRFTDFAGRVGSSDLEGNITEDPGVGGKPDVTMDLSSRNVDLADLGGFIGTPAGRRATPGQTPAQERALAKAESSKTLLPNTPISLPKLRAANIHLKYRGEHIENKFVPFDKLIVAMDMVDGRITLHPIDLTVGPEGRVVSNIDLTPVQDDALKVRLDTKFQHMNLSRLLRATHTFKGEGIVGGEARIDSTGKSLATIMGNGDGELKLALVSGGNLSALLVDITGLEFGNALLSALGVPNRTNIQCFVTDMPLQHGKLDSKVFLLDTDEGRITGTGGLDFSDQMLDFTLTTRSKHFSIGSLPGPIHITGPLGDPSIRPGAEVVARAGAAAGLGILLTPLGALLPTIQFGVGIDNACTHALAEEREPLKVHPPGHRRSRTRETRQS